MSQSLSAVERRNPPPRRKSCETCTRAKRRCDLGTPTCLRCSQRKLACVYPQAPVGRRRAPTLPAISPPVDPPSNDTSTEPLVRSNRSLELGVMSGCPASPLQHLDHSSPDLDLGWGRVCPVFEIAEDGGNQDWSWTTAADAAPPAAGLVPCADSRLSPSGWVDDMDVVSVLVSHRFQYAIDEMVRAPKRMVFENQTPWCHPQTYAEAMPRSMQGADSQQPYSPD